MLDPRRTLSQLRRTRNRAVVRARRHPRISVGIFTAVAVTVAVVGSLAILNSRGPGAASVAPVTSPFTYAGSWSLIELQRHIEAGEVATITANSADTTTGQGGGLLVRTTTGQVVSVDLEVTSAEAVNALRALGYGDLLTTEALAVSRPPSEGGNNPLTIILPLTMMVLTLILVLRISRRGNPAQRDASNFKTIMPTARPPDGVVPEAAEGAILAVRLDDVAGCDEAKLELTEAIEFLKSPERFHKLGARIPRGIMLYGPPGTGKTMLARAVAAEAGVPFHHASGSEFVEKYVGVGARRIRDLFAQARKLGRGVIFFDEFDAIGKARGGPNSHEEREQTLNQLLVELDGFATTEDIIVIAATNRLDTLDPAVLRPGRFNRKIHVGLPDVKGRQEILAVHARNKPIDPSVDLEDTARKTYGFSGAMLADLLNEGAILAARRASEVIGPEDLHGGWLKVAVGTSRRRSMDERERSIIAAHEVGHAICGKVHGDKRKVEEISLFAHGEALGVTVSSQEDNDLPSETDLRARLVALMGGRAAEELLFHEVTGGASNDFEAANKIATAMVTRWGMGRDPDATDHGISGRGTLSFLVPAPGVRNLPSDVQSAATRAISAILDESYAEACRTLVEHMETLRRLASYLVEHERVDGDTFDELFDGRRPVPNSGDEWRAATARPRAWGDVVDLAAHRVRTIPVVAAAIALPAPEPAPAVASVVTPATDSAPVDITPALAPSPISATTATATVPRRRRSVVRRLTRGPVASRRLRHAAAGLLEKAQNWLRATEPEGGQL